MSDLNAEHNLPAQHQPLNAVSELFAYFSDVDALYRQLTCTSLSSTCAENMVETAPGRDDSSSAGHISDNKSDRNSSRVNAQGKRKESASAAHALDSDQVERLSQDFCAVMQYISSAPQIAMTIIEPGDFPQGSDRVTDYAQKALSHNEYRKFLTFKKERRKLEWLLGRMAAKHALRQLANIGAQTSPDVQIIELGCEESGRPFVEPATALALGWPVCISIAHKDGTTVALAHKSIDGTPVGVDVESVKSREPGFERLACTPIEIEQLERCAPAERDSLLTKFWCAKEAVGKALGNGLSNNPKSLQVERLIGDLTNGGRFGVKVCGSQKPEYAAHCLVMPKKILAISLLEVVQ